MKQAINAYLGLTLGTLIYAAFTGLERMETMGRVIILIMIFAAILCVIGLFRIFNRKTSR